jgi:hypothetical protein
MSHNFNWRLKMSIGKTARALILQGLSNAEVLAEVKRLHEKAETSPACIAWYRSNMRKNGLLPKRAVVAKMTIEEQIKHLQDELAKLQATAE